jgi:hypothetical protein
MKTMTFFQIQHKDSLKLTTLDGLLLLILTTVLRASMSACAPEKPIASSSRESQESTASISAETDTAEVFSPQVIRPLPKPLPRKGTQNRRKVKSAVLTGTPEKEALKAIEPKRNLKDAKRQVDK